MGRIEKRKLEREIKKNDKRNTTNNINKIWYDKLPLDKKIYIENFIKNRAIENDSLIISILDKCTAAAIDDFIDINLVDIKNIISHSDNYIADYKYFLDIEGEEGFNMIENEELRKNVEDKIKLHLANGIDKAKGLNLLKKEFNLPNAELSDMWAACKPVAPKKTRNTPIENIDVKSKEIETVGPAKEKSKLRVIKVIEEVQGEYGTYIKSQDGVTINGICYIGKDKVKEEKDIILKEYENKMNIVKKKMEELDIELKKIREQGTKEIEKYVELENVFDL